MKAPHISRYRLTTLSHIVLSLRASAPFYKGVDYDEPDFNMIYPFYQYGDYSVYDPKGARYYMPGSSIKGALLADNTDAMRNRVYMDDIPVKTNDIEVRKLTKAVRAAFLYEPGTEGQHPKFEEFFGGVVGVEMLKPVVTLLGSLRTDQPLESLIEHANNHSHTLLAQYMSQIESLLSRLQLKDYEDSGKEAFANGLQAVLDKCKVWVAECGLLFLGGYKGLLRSLTLPDQAGVEAIRPYSAVYADEDGAPFGFARIENV